LTILPNNPTFKLLISHPIHFLSLGFGTGLAPKAPGTWGTVMGLPLFWMIKDYSIATQLGVIAALFLIGIYLCDVTGKALGVSDHGGIVWDEIVAMMLVLTFAPVHVLWWFFAFVLFRLFDIWKPFPIGQIDAKVKGGFGVMLDDLLAAIFAIVLLKAALWIL
jgi:phosphatidylglycerophosphatase A